MVGSVGRSLLAAAVLAALASTTSDAQGPGAAADRIELTVDASKPGATIDRNLFGQFA